MKKQDSQERCNSECQRYEQQICHILEILGERDEDIKYSLVWDDTCFRDLNVSPKELTLLSRTIGTQVMRSTLVVESAQFIFNNRLDISKCM